MIIASIISTKRIETFLEQDEVHRELEGVKHLARCLSQSDSNLDAFEEQNPPAGLVENTSNPSTSSTPVESLSLDRRKVTLKKGSMVTKSIKYKKDINSKISRLSLDLGLRLNDDEVLSVTEARFGWTKSDKCILTVDRLSIPKGKLTLVVGKNGSGKSTLIAALLGEMYKVSGNLTWDKYASIAFVSQNPWLQNATIKDNILFGEAYRPKRYGKVLEACSLHPDIDLMPSKDLTEIGERGINLSGGQRQRIALARAMYSSANVVILDDPLSSLDNEVGKSIIEECIRKMLIRYNRTTILVTQKLQLVYNADMVREI